MLTTRGGWTALHSGAVNGYYRMSELLIAAGANVDAKTKFDISALHLASRMGHVEVVKLLIQKGANPSVAMGPHLINPLAVAVINDKYEVAQQLLNAGAASSTALSFACYRGDSRFIRLLLEHGADPVFEQSRTALHLAVISGSIEAVRILLDERWKLDPNAQNTEDGATPLIHAAESGSADVAYLLLQAGAKPDVSSHNGITPLWIASNRGYLRVAELLIDAGADASIAACDGNAPVHMAASGKGRSGIIELLLNAHANLEARNNSGLSPLHIASQLGGVDSVKALLQGTLAKADIEAKAPNGMTPLFHAVGGCDPEVIEFLCTEGADITACGGDGCPLLHFACTKGVEVVAALLVNGADPSAKAYNGVAPLQVAILQARDEEVALLLISEGAELSPHFWEPGFHPIHMAAALGFSEVAKVLARHMPDLIQLRTKAGGLTAVHFAAENSHTEIMKFFVNQMPSACQLKDDNGWTALHYAAKKDFEMVNILLQAGADVEARNNDGNTALHLASASGNTGICGRLLEAGPMSLAAINNYGAQPLHHASMFGRILAVEILLKSGANVNATGGNSGITALHMACEGGHESVVRLLLQWGADTGKQSQDGSTALLLACSSGNINIVTVLLDANCDATIRKSDGTSPLDAAAAGGHMQIVDLLRLRVN